MENIAFSQTEITGGFWKKKQDMVRKTTVYAVYDRFCDTGRFDAFRCDWKEGEPNKPHFFWDSDVAKWMEGAAYITSQKRSPKLEKIVDGVVSLIEKNQGEDGYFNIYFTVVEPEKRFSCRDLHELYCAGHLLEAAVAYAKATGKKKFLSLMIKYIDYIEQRFVIQKDTAFRTPGHEEIELALVHLYEYTGEKRYLNMAKYFIDTRGTEEDARDYPLPQNVSWQADKPVREMTEAKGHAVRAAYLYSGMADVAYYTQDAVLQKTCETLFDDIITKKMYITGGIGSSSCGEAFTVAYDLSNLLAYTESCAAIGLVFFASRMLRFGADSKYSDTIERVLYNGFLSSVSLDGKAFFYENPLEVIPYLKTRDGFGRGIHWPQTQRSEVFGCSCCPPNIVRFLPSVANLLYSDDGKTLFVHQFMESRTTLNRNGETLTVEQKTKYPENGKVSITLYGGNCRVAVRVPWWSDAAYPTEKGYAYFDMKDKETLSLDFGMKIKYIEARPEAYFDCGKYAVMRGPVVYCMESADNGAYLRDIRLDGRAAFRYGKHETLGVPQLTVKAYRRAHEENAPLYSEKHNSLVPMTAKLIPYYAFANRGVAEMQVWHLVK